MSAESAAGVGTRPARGPVVAAGGLAVLAAFAVWGAFSIPGGQGFAAIDARDFPRVLSVVLALLAMATVVQALRGKIPDEAHSEEDPPLPGARVRMGWMFAAILCTPAALHLFGFLAGGIVGFAGVTRAFGARSWPAILGWGAVATLVVWLVFDKLLTLKLGNDLIHLPY